MLPLSVVIITYNEEANIAACIGSVKDIASEILVLDSNSTDKTREIAAGIGAKVVIHDFEGHIQQKNIAKDMAKEHWVLSLDADERLSPELLISIVKAMEHTECDGYEMNRLNYFCGKPVKTCGWYPDRKLRLWKKDAGNWGGVNPHDRFELQNEQSVGFLQGDLIHFTYPTRDSMKKQVEKFANIAALQNKDKNPIFLFFKMLASSAFKFIKSFIIKGGIRDGSDGFFICRMQAKEVFLKYKRALTL